MKIISFNIGIKIDNSEKIAEYLFASGADIICLQEVMRPLEDSVSSMYRSEETIREKLKSVFSYHFFAPEWVGDKLIKGEKIRDFKGMAEQGKLILSKYPILYGANHFYHKVYEYSPDRTRFYEGDDHARALQIADLDVRGTVIQIGNVHGIYSRDKQDSEGSLLQNKFIIEKLCERNKPTILLGDFNLAPDTESIALINKEYMNLISKFSIGATQPEEAGKHEGAKHNTLDYIFFSSEFSAKSCIVDLTDISDHYPLIAEIDIL